MQPPIQLYALRELDRSLPSIVTAAADLGYVGVEFAYRLHAAAVEDVRVAMDRGGIEPTGAHVPMDHFDAFESTLSRYAQPDCPMFVIPFLDADQFADWPSIQAAAADLGDLASRLAARNVSLGYHNHDHEFVLLDGETAYDALAAATPVTVDLQLDVGWRRWPVRIRWGCSTGTPTGYGRSISRTTISRWANLSTSATAT